MKAAQWIDRVKRERGWDSDYRVAKELQLGRQTVSTYRSRPDSTMDEDVAVKVAAALGEPPEFILIDQAAERARSEPARHALASALERIMGKARAGGGGKAHVDITPAASLADPCAGPGLRSGIRIVSV